MRVNTIIVAMLLWFPLSSHAVEVQQVDVSDIQAWLVQEHGVPIIALNIAIEGAGYSSDPEGYNGRASLMASLFNEGAGNLKATQFQQTLESHAITMNAHATADTFIINMEMLAEKKEEAFKLLKLALQQPHYDDDAVARMKKTLATYRTRLRENPSYISQRALINAAFNGHGYANAPYGTTAGMNAITPTTLHDWHTRIFNVPCMKISVVGAISARSLTSLLDDTLAALPHNETCIQGVRHDFPADIQRINIDKPLPQSVVQFAAPAIYRDDPRFYAAYTLMHIVGGSGLTSRLSEALRQKHGLVYYVHTGLSSRNHSAYFEGEFSTNTTQAESAIIIMKEVLQNIRDNGIAQAELNDAIAYITGSFPLRLDKNSKIANYLMHMQLHKLGVDYLNKRNSYFETVTLQQVNEMARALLDNSQLLIVHTGDSSYSSDTEQKTP